VTPSTQTADPRERALGEVLEFMRLLWALDHALQSRSKMMRRELGLTGPQRLVVRLVGRFPGISARDLASLLRLHPSTLTGILQRLGAQDLLRRDADPADARRARFTLTNRGRKADVPAPRTVEAAMRRALAKLPRKRLDAARSVLSGIVGQLEREDCDAKSGARRPSPRR
jgi:DNA-binding MarR family transcriptional regulator